MTSIKDLYGKVRIHVAAFLTAATMRFSKHRNELPLYRSKNFYDGMYGELLEQIAMITTFHEEAMGSPITKEWKALQELVQNASIKLVWLHALYEAVIFREVEKYGKVKRHDAALSTYAGMLDLHHEEFGDLEEMVRVGCLHVYHKFEDFRNEFFDLVNAAFGVSGSSGIRETVNDLYKFDPRSGVMFIKVVNELAFVADSFKHMGGKPIPRTHGSTHPPPARFDGADRNKVLVIPPTDLLRDIQLLKQVVIGYFHTLTVVHHRRRLDLRLADPAFAALPIPHQRALQEEHSTRTKQATHLMTLLFDDIPVKVKSKW